MGEYARVRRAPRRDSQGPEGPTSGARSAPTRPGDREPLVDARACGLVGCALGARTPANGSINERDLRAWRLAAESRRSYGRQPRL